MFDLIITAGQHRNEKSAAVLAPKVAAYLKKKGYNVLLLFNPEKRSLLEIAKEAYQDGKRIKRRELENLLNSWESEIETKYPDAPVFNFHNYGINPTDFLSPKENRAELKSINGVYGSMDLGDFKGNDLAYKIKYCGDESGALIEIPEITETSRTSEELAILKKVIHPKTFSIYCSYFLSTDLSKTRKEGLMGGSVVRILTKGIDYLVKGNS